MLTKSAIGQPVSASAPRLAAAGPPSRKRDERGPHARRAQAEREHEPGEPRQHERGAVRGARGRTRGAPGSSARMARARRGPLRSRLATATRAPGTRARSRPASRGPGGRAGRAPREPRQDQRQQELRAGEDLHGATAPAPSPAARPSSRGPRRARAALEGDEGGERRGHRRRDGVREKTASMKSPPSLTAAFGRPEQQPGHERQVRGETGESPRGAPRPRPAPARAPRPAARARARSPTASRRSADSES